MDKSRFVSEGTSSLKRERAILFEEKTSFSLKKTNWEWVVLNN